jgi:ATP-dependent Clp protease ATP-binding subunit ClpC
VFERFTEKAIKVIMLAQEEARRLGHNFVGTEQLLLGLIGEGNGAAAKTLKAVGVNLKDARIEVQKIIGRGSGFVTVEIPFTPRAKRVIEFALAESRKLGTEHIDTQHLLLGLIREGEGVAARVLENLGVALAELRHKTLKSFPEGVSKLESMGTGSEGLKDTGKLSCSVNSSAPSGKSFGKTSTFLDFIIAMLPPAAQQLVIELEEVVRNKENALQLREFEKAAHLLNKQIELTEKVRRFSEASD